MAKIIEGKNLIKIGKEPVVILPLKKWREFERILEDLEDALRFYEVFYHPKNQKSIPFEKVKKILKLP